MNTTQKYETIKKIFWDYHFEQLPVDKIISGNFSAITEYERNFIFRRMLERLTWYELLDILGTEKIKQLITREMISKLPDKALRNKYEFIGRILSGENLSFTGWGDAYYQRIKHTLFSNRWYRS